jgi:small subunit ribosomal protein S10
MNTKTNNMQIIWKLKSFHSYYLNDATSKILRRLNQNKNYKLNCVFLPRKYERYTILRSPHVDKKARDQFERTTHKRLLQAKIIHVKDSRLINPLLLKQIINSLNLGTIILEKYKFFCI